MSSVRPVLVFYDQAVFQCRRPIGNGHAGWCNSSAPLTFAKQGSSSRPGRIGTMVLPYSAAAFRTRGQPAMFSRQADLCRVHSHMRVGLPTPHLCKDPDRCICMDGAGFLRGAQRARRRKRGSLTRASVSHEDNQSEQRAAGMTLCRFSSSVCEAIRVDRRLTLEAPGSTIYSW